MSLEITIITFTMRLYLFFCVKGSGTKHFESSNKSLVHSWHTASFERLVTHQVTRCAPECLLALNCLAMTQDVITISRHLAFQCVFFMARVYRPCRLWWQSDACMYKRWFICLSEVQFTPDDGLTWEREKGKEARRREMYAFYVFQYWSYTLCKHILSNWTI